MLMGDIINLQLMPLMLIYSPHFGNIRYYCSEVAGIDGKSDTKSE